MRLRRIELRGWQCFVDELALGPLSPGLNVIHAPNGRGKSTLFAALRRAIFDGHRTGGAEMQALRPWGRDLAPCVNVELERDGTLYRIEKRFLDQPAARLLRDEAGRFTPLAENEKADEQVRRLMAAAPPGRGAANKPEHWGLAAVLWVPQGKLELGSLSGPLATKIRTSLGTQTGVATDVETNPASTGIEAEIERRYSAIFTGEGRYRTGLNAAPVVALDERLKALEAERLALLPKVDAFEAASRRVEELRESRAHAARREEAAAQALVRLRERAAAYDTLDATRRESVALEAKARGELEALDRAVTAIAQTRGRLRDVQTELARLIDAKPALDAAVAAARSRCDAAAETRATIQARRGEADALAAVAEAAEAFVKMTARVRELDGRIARVTDADAAMSAVRAQLDTLNAPTARDLAALRKADADRRDARTRLEASLIALTFEPIAPTTLRIRVGETPGTMEAQPNRSLVVRGSPEVVVELPGVGTIRARGPASSVDSLRATAEAAEARFAALAEPFGTSDLDALQGRTDRAAELTTSVNATKANRDALLGTQTPDTVASERAAAAMQVERLLADHPEWRLAAPEPAALTDAARAHRREQDRQASDAQHAYELANDARQAAERAAGEHVVRIDGVRRDVATLAASLAQHEAIVPDEATRERRLIELKAEWARARQAVDDAAAKLAEFTEDPRAMLAQATRDLEQLRATATQKNDAEKRAEGELNKLAQEGAYSRLSEVLEQIEATREQLTRERASAAAIKLLRDTLHAERRRAVEAVCGPVEQLATEILHRIAGRRLGPVRLDESFAARGVMPNAMTVTADPVELDRLSGGEQEQVHLAVRLALADVLSRAEGNQLVVLDDVLIATDSGRLGRIRTVLAEVAQRLQIVVLTCHPERYTGIDGAAYFDLDSLVDAR